MRSSSHSNNIPRLQPPGAGLPWYELLIARHIVFPRACRKLTWATADSQFQSEGAAILAILDSIPANRLTERVLIRRLIGMEDSSRNWSAAMTVEHLNIVGNGIRRTVDSLKRGVIPSAPARTEDVKPTGEIPAPDVRAAFVQLLADAKADEATAVPVAPGVGPQYAHPWFGPIGAFEWHCLLGIHQAIHRRQLETIRRLL